MDSSSALLSYVSNQNVQVGSETDLYDLAEAGRDVVRLGHFNVVTASELVEAFIWERDDGLLCRDPLLKYVPNSDTN